MELVVPEDQDDDDDDLAEFDGELEAIQEKNEEIQALKKSQSRGSSEESRRRLNKTPTILVEEPWAPKF